MTLPLTWWQKAFWNAFALFIVLPLRTISFIIHDLPYYGCYVIWVEAMVFPYYRQGYHDWWANNQEISVVPDDKHVVTFMMRGQKYQFHEFNCCLPKNEPGRIRVRFHSKPSVKAGDDENLDMMEAQVQIIAANDDIFWHHVRQAQLSCFNTIVKILLGVLWLQCVFVPTTNLFFLLGALVLEGCKRASTYGLFWFQISPLHLVDDFTIFCLFAWMPPHVGFIFLSLGTILAKFPLLKDRQDPPGFHYIASPMS